MILVHLVINRDGSRVEGDYELPSVPREGEKIFGDRNMNFALAVVSEVIYDITDPMRIVVMLR